jgi:L-fuconolactonase
VIVDTHVHVVADDLERYPLNPAGVGTQWFRESPVTVEEFAEQSAAVGVERAVLVQAFGAYTYDNSYAADAAAEHSGRFVSVGIPDAADAGAPDALRALATMPGFGGIRLFAIGDSVRLDDERSLELCALADELGLAVTVALLVPQLPQLRTLLERFPQQPVLLDHCGFPDLDGGPPFAAAQPLFELADCSNLHLKVTTHALDTPDVLPRLVEVFGADRVLWGSDFPQVQDRPYPELVALGRSAADALTPEERDAFLGGNARRLFPALA